MFLEWPILKQESFFIKHVERLLNIKDVNKLYSENLELFPEYYRYFKRQKIILSSNKKGEAKAEVLHTILCESKSRSKFLESESPKVIAVFSLICAELNEKIKHMVILHKVKLFINNLNIISF